MLATVRPQVWQRWASSSAIPLRTLIRLFPSERSYIHTIIYTILLYWAVTFKHYHVLYTALNWFNSDLEICHGVTCAGNSNYCNPYSSCILLCTIGKPCSSRHTNFSSSPRTGHSRHSKLIGALRNKPSNCDPVDGSCDVVGIFKEN